MRRTLFAELPAAHPRRRQTSAKGGRNGIRSVRGNPDRRDRRRRCRAAPREEEQVGLADHRSDRHIRRLLRQRDLPGQHSVPGHQGVRSPGGRLLPRPRHHRRRGPGARRVPRHAQHDPADQDRLSETLRGLMTADGIGGSFISVRARRRFGGSRPRLGAEFQTALVTQPRPIAVGRPGKSRALWARIPRLMLRGARTARRHKETRRDGAERDRDQDQRGNRDEQLGRRVSHGPNPRLGHGDAVGPNGTSARVGGLLRAPILNR